MLSKAAFIFSASLVSFATQGATLYEGFESDVFANGWIQENESLPIGDLGWIQPGGTWQQQSGSPNSYITVGYRSASLSGGIVDNWLLTPVVEFDGNSILRFWTMTPEIDWADRLEVRLSRSGGGTNPESFSILLLTINSTLIPSGMVGGYPNFWTEYTVDLSEYSGANGRIAFRYTLPDNISYADGISIDTVSIGPVPELSVSAMLMCGLVVLLSISSRRIKA